MSYKVRPPSNKQDANQWQPRYIKANPWLKTANSDNPSSVPLPLYIRPQSAFGAEQGRVSIVVGSKPAFDKPVEGVTLDVRLPTRVAAADPTATHGQCTYDVASNSVRWVIEKFPNDKTPCLSVQVTMSAEDDAPSVHKPPTDVAGAKRRVQLQELVDITASFRVQGASVSGIKVETLQVRNEKYKPTQGVRYHTRSGTVVVRT
jgi:AP-3 complex subunit mu